MLHARLHTTCWSSLSFIVFQKYIDIFGGTIGFWLFGYALSGNADAKILGEAQDYIFWFFRVCQRTTNVIAYWFLSDCFVFQFTFATNTATILGGTLVGQKHVHMRAPAIFVYSFVMTVSANCNHFQLSIGCCVYIRFVCSKLEYQIFLVDQTS